MKRTRFASALLFTLLLAPAGAAFGPQSDLDRELQAALEATGDGPLADVWEHADRLRRGQAPAPLVEAIDRRLVAGELTERQLLLLASLRLTEARPDLARLAGALLPLLDSQAPAHAEAAAELLGSPAFKDLEPSVREPILAQLLDDLRDTDNPPGLRLACAVSLTRVGAGRERRAALNEMRAFLDSADVRLRTMGALALARGGDVETGIAELERLASLPGPDGRLAAAYLSQEDTRRLWDRKIQNDKLQYESRRSSDETGSFPELERLQEVLALIERTHLVGDKRDARTLINAALAGMMRSIEAGGAWLTSEEVRRWYAGDVPTDATDVGAVVVADPYDGLLTLTRLAVGGPAWRAGLHEGDKIVRIDDWPTLGRPLDEGMLRLRGEPGTVRKLYVWRRGMEYEYIDRPTEDMLVELEFEPARFDALAHDLLPGKVGLIEVRVFQEGSAAAVAAALEDLLERGAERFVLDLRATAGDDLEQAVQIADLFLPTEKLVVRTERRLEGGESHFTREPDAARGLPCAVVVDRFSSPSAEVVAAALQDHDRAVLVGGPTPGRGAVRQLVQLPGETDDLFEDANGNGRYDAGEELVQDWNGNGRFDYAPRALLSVGNYVRPSGRPIRREIDEQGTVVHPGGVEPERILAAIQWEPWQLEEVHRIQRSGRVHAWAAGLDPAKVRELARAGAAESADYPGLAELRDQLKTPLALDDVRSLARHALRRRAQELEGSPLPADYQTDRQLQGAIAELLKAQGESYRDVEAFARSFDLDEDTYAAGDLIAAVISDVGRDRVDEVRARLESALQGDHKLTEEELLLLRQILSSALDRK